MAPPLLEGVFVPVLTPFRADLAPDAERFVGFCKHLLDQGAHGLAVFGTTSEANSLSIEERIDLLDRLIDAGVPAARLMPGTGACAIPDTVRLTAHAVARGCGGVLLLPPFYYKEPTDDGLHAFLSQVVQRVGSAELRVYLYHIPPMAKVGWPVPLVERLLADLPGTVVGIKDSSGDWASISGWITRFPGFAVFPGSELYFLDALRLGAAGCIAATGNINAHGLRRVWDRFKAGDAAGADAAQDAASAIRRACQSAPMIPGLKRVVARSTGDAAWALPRPPLRRLDDGPAESLFAALGAAGL